MLMSAGLQQQLMMLYLSNQLAASRCNTHSNHSGARSTQRRRRTAPGGSGPGARRTWRASSPRRAGSARPRRPRPRRPRTRSEPGPAPPRRCRPRRSPRRRKYRRSRRRSDPLQDEGTRIYHAVFYLIMRQSHTRVAIFQDNTTEASSKSGKHDNNLLSIIT